jgi:hypothetical protein
MPLPSVIKDRRHHRAGAIAVRAQNVSSAVLILSSPLPLQDPGAQDVYEELGFQSVMYV